MGKIISVTIPLPLVDDLQKEADVLGISRSRFISNILLKWQELNKHNITSTGKGANKTAIPKREDL